MAGESTEMPLNNPRADNNLLPIQVKDLEKFVNIAGHRFIDTLHKFHASIYTDDEQVDIPAKHPSGNVFEALGLSKKDFTKNDFAAILDNRIILFSTWFRQKEHLPAEKYMQIDFMFLADWVSREPVSKAYKKVQAHDGTGGKGLLASETTFLRQLKEIVTSVNDDCTIILLPSDKRREWIYKRGLQGMSNIKIIPWEVVEKAQRKSEEQHLQG